MNYPEHVRQLFIAHKTEENIGPMEKYMRNKFSFLGNKSPLRKQLMRQFYQESGIKKEPFQPDFVLSLWQLEHREFQLAAMEYLEVSLKKLQRNDIKLLEELITTKAWWDTVDMLAQKPVGEIAKRYPDVIEKEIESWNASDHLWLLRSAILFQLKYKEKTDEELLYRYIKTHADQKEFFIQKAVGWVLREYSKTNPDSVRNFIQSNKLSRLSIREGSKYLDE